MRTGDVVEDFALFDQNGTLRRLSDLLAAGPVALFFFPAAMTGGCTAESCHFRDLVGEFRTLGSEPVGISHDSVGRLKQFAAMYDFDFPLLSDEDGAVASMFSVRRSFGPLATRRATFVIASDRKLLAEIRSEIRMRHHADRALRVLTEQTSKSV